MASSPFSSCFSCFYTWPIFSSYSLLLVLFFSNRKFCFLTFQFLLCLLFIQLAFLLFSPKVFVLLNVFSFYLSPAFSTFFLFPIFPIFPCGCHFFLFPFSPPLSYKTSLLCSWVFFMTAQQDLLNAPKWAERLLTATKCALYCLNM